MESATILMFRPRPAPSAKPAISIRRLNQRLRTIEPELRALQKQINDLDKIRWSKRTAHRLKCLRQYLGYETAAEFARLLGIPPARYRRYERSFPNAGSAGYYLIWIMDRANIHFSADWLFIERGYPTPDNTERPPHEPA